MNELQKVYKVLAREYLKWSIIDRKPTTQEKEAGSQKLAVHILNELYDITSDIYGYNINPVKALENHNGGQVDVLRIYEPSTPDLGSRRITKEQYVEISKELLRTGM